MSEEYYSLSSHGAYYHRSHHHRHHRGTGGGFIAEPEAQTPSPAEARSQESIDEEELITHDLETDTYRLSPDLIKALKGLDIVPAKKYVAKKSGQKKQEVPKTKQTHKTIKAIEKKVLKNEKKKAAKKSEAKESDKKPVSVKQVGKATATLTKTSAAKKPASSKKIISQPTPRVVEKEQPREQEVGAPEKVPAPVLAEQPKATAAVQTVAQRDEEDEQYDEPMLAREENGAEDIEGEEGDEGGDIFDSDTLTMTGALASGGTLSERQYNAAKGLSDHLMKQWKPPAGCRDATPVEVEITVQHDGQIATKIVRNSSMPILNFSVKRNLAQFATKAVQEMLENARGVKLIIIFKG